MSTSMEAGGSSTNKRNPSKNPAKDRVEPSVTTRIKDKEEGTVELAASVATRGSGSVTVRGAAVTATARQVKLDPTAAAWNPTNTSPTVTGPVASTPIVSAWSNKQSTIDTIKAAATKPVVGTSQTAKVLPDKASKGQVQPKATQKHPHKKGPNNYRQDKTAASSKAPQKITSSMKQPQAPPIISAVGGKNTSAWTGATAAAPLVAKHHHPQLPQAALETISGKKHIEQHHQRQHHAHHNNSKHHHYHNKDHAGKRLDVKDANLLEPQDGMSDQDGIVRFSHTALLQLRVLFLNPPEDMEVSSTVDAGNATTSKWHREFLWTSPTRVSDIMLQHLHPRNTKPYLYGDQQHHPSKNHQPATSVGTNTEEQADGKSNYENKTSSKDDSNIFINEFGEEIYVKPLVINEETRWKPKSAAKDSADSDKDLDAAVIQKALLILNKLTPTNFPKLSEQFCDEVISSESLLASGIKLLIAKAQQEPHFCPMYAQVCLTLSSKPLLFETNDEENIDKRQKPGKRFKRHLLEECQQEFESSTGREKLDNTEDLTSEEVEYRTRLAKKKYLGHMTFIGEIYKVGLCNTKVMLMCLPILLDSSSAGGNVDEENIECFVKLIATIGEKLQNDCTAQAQQKGKPEYLEQLDMSWERVHSIIHPQNHETRPISNRIKFMLQDLIELRDNGWVARRKLETAKTLQEIHSEAAKEMPRGRISSSSSLRSLAGGSASSLMRGFSTEDVKNLDNATDSDGFTTVAKVKRTQSQSSLRRAESGGSTNSGISNPPGSFRRSISDATSSTSIRRRRSQEKVSDNVTSSSQLPDSSSSSFIQESKGAIDAEATLTPEADRSLSNFDTIPELSDEQPLIKLLSPAECGQKVKSVLKDYLVNHDASDAYVSYEELIQPSQPHSLERGSKCVTASLQFMMEQSKSRLETFLLLWKILVLGNVEGEKKPALISRPMILIGLRHPLDALADIMIDAPLANVILIKIVASTMHWGALVADISFLLDLAAESSSLAEGYAEFSVNLLRALSQLSGCDAKLVLDNNADTIRKLMTPNEAEEWKSVTDFIKFISERGTMF